MIVAVHDSESNTKYPNLALMKISAFHKAQGDTVEWFNPFFADQYDKIYSSKVFTWTPVDPYLPERTIKGGTGYGIMDTLPDEIEHICPDYSLYPDCNRSYGFLTRGCLRSCPWCIVPKKEGKIRPHADITEFARHKHVTLMDNNVLACEWGLKQIDKIAGMDLRIDFNQGLDARLIDKQVARLLARVKWERFIRLACDSQAQKESVKNAVENLRTAGYKGEIFCYVLIKGIDEALDRIEFCRSIGIKPFGQPYRDFATNKEPDVWQRRLARYVNVKSVFNACSWGEYAENYL